jgi:hypothetical protein
MFFIPFSGDPTLFDYRPSTYYTIFPRGQVIGNELRVEYPRTDHNAQEVRAQFDRDLELIKNNVENSRREVEAFNRQLEAEARQRVTARRERLLKDQGLVAALGFPLKARPDAPRTYAVPEVRRRIVTPPPASTAPYTPDPGEHQKVGGGHAAIGSG